LNRFLKIAAIAIATIALIYVFLRNSNLQDVWRIMRHTDALWFAAALAVNFSALIFRTFRWRTLIDPDAPPRFYPTFFANTVGYMLSTVLPIRAGDVARPALLSRRTTVRFSAALGTVLTERILDLYALLLLFVYFVIVHWTDFASHRAFFIIKSGAVGAIVVLSALTILILGIFFFRGGMRRVHQWVGRFVPQRFRAAWMNFYDAFLQTLDISRRPLAMFKVLLCTVAIWTALTAQFWVTSVAMHRPLPFDSSFFISGTTTVGLAIPTPGGVGGFHKICQLILTTFYGFDIDSSVAAALMFHIVGTVPVVVTGLILFAHAGLSIKDIKTRTED
jgi:glycosyltransferase 2 family protein